MMQSKDLAARFEAYSDWRRTAFGGHFQTARMAVAAGARRRQRRPRHPASARAPAPGQAGGRIRRRVLSRQVRADQRDLLRRLRAATAAVRGGAHDHVPDRIALRLDAPAIDPASAHRDARARRDGRRIQELRRRVGDPAARHVVGGQDDARFCRRFRRSSACPSRWHASTASTKTAMCCRAELGGRRAGGRHPVLAPRGDQLPAPAAAAGPCHPGHAGPERDRHRARTHAEPPAQRARRVVHPRRRRGRDQDRHRRLERPSGRRIPPTRKAGWSS